MNLKSKRLKKRIEKKALRLFREYPFNVSFSQFRLDQKTIDTLKVNQYLVPDNLLLQQISLSLDDGSKISIRQSYLSDVLCESFGKDWVESYEHYCDIKLSIPGSVSIEFLSTNYKIYQLLEYYSKQFKQIL